MVYEIILALHRAAERVGLSVGERAGLFFENGAALLRQVSGGKPYGTALQA